MANAPAAGPLFVLPTASFNRAMDLRSLPKSGGATGFLRRIDLLSSKIEQSTVRLLAENGDVPCPAIYANGEKGCVFLLLDPELFKGGEQRFVYAQNSSKKSYVFSLPLPTHKEVVEAGAGIIGLKAHMNIAMMLSNPFSSISSDDINITVSTLGGGNLTLKEGMPVVSGKSGMLGEPPHGRVFYLLKPLFETYFQPITDFLREQRLL